MKKLEDIPKKDLFKAPEGYFDKLPGIVQARVATPVRQPLWLPVLKFAAPVVVLMVAGLIWFSGPTQRNFEAELATIDTEQLTAYLDNTELAWGETEEAMDWSEFDLLELQDRVYSTFTIDDTRLDLLEEEIFELDNF
ncbi:MAG: hypothetical protein DYG99_14455 [Bacteroidetes bacterium CHB5]|nr:hypothetical protein [Bacteroidetes bacterium CHB5]